MSGLKWYAHRLQSMGHREMLWRATMPFRTARARGSRGHNVAELVDALDSAEALERFRSGVDRPILLDRQRAQVIRDENPALVAALLSAADLAVERSFCFFGYPAVTLEQPIDWHYDPVSDVRWPEVLSRKINHRIFAGDVKWIWELNRLQHLPWLAQAWLFTGESRYERAAFEHLDSWMDQNPPGRGVAWRGAFEAGIRAISIAIAVQGLRDSTELTASRFERILRVLAESANRCWHDRSLFSSANNHLVGEMAGLAVIALMFPDFVSSASWESWAVQTLSSEADKQILADGVGAEQAVGYQTFTVELLYLVAALLAQRDGHAPNQIVEAIVRSSTFLFAVVGDQDPCPRYGDDDEGFALRLGPEAVRSVRDHLGIVSAHGWGVTARGTVNDTLTRQWYRAMAQSSSAELVGLAPALSAERPASFFAPDGGLAVLRSGRRRTTMDVGPLGYLSIAAHGHADALAITLSIDGQDVITDPGTGSYYGHPEWRPAMRSTGAHATVCIDGQDQSLNAGSFMWLRHARTRVRQVDLVTGVVDAEHDGYTRLPGKPVHRRWLIAPSDDWGQLVVDMVTGNGHHEVRTNWPLHPSLEVQRIPFGHIVTRQNVGVSQLLYSSTAPLLIDEVRGDVRENRGWWSDRLESRMPAWWLGAVANAELPIVVATLIVPIDRRRIDDLFVERCDEYISVCWAEDSDLRTVRIDLAPSAHATISIQD